MKLLPLLIVLVLVGCSGSPYVREEMCVISVVGTEDYNQFKESVSRDLRAIKQELTGVDTGCRFEVVEEYMQGICGYVTSTGSRLEICKHEKVETVCRGDVKEVDIYSP